MNDKQMAASCPAGRTAADRAPVSRRCGAEAGGPRRGDGTARDARSGCRADLARLDLRCRRWRDCWALGSGCGPVALGLAAYCGVTSVFHLIPSDPWQMSIFVKNWSIAGGCLCAGGGGVGAACDPTRPAARLAISGAAVRPTGPPPMHPTEAISFVVYQPPPIAASSVTVCA